MAPLWTSIVIAVNGLHASNPESADKDLDHDTVGTIFGPDSRGRQVKGMGFGASKTRVKYTTPYISTIPKQQSTQETLQGQYTKLSETMLHLQEWMRNSQAPLSNVRTPSTAHELGGRCKLMWRQDIAAEGRLSATHAEESLHDIIVDIVFFPDVQFPEEEGTLGNAVGNIIQWPTRRTHFY